MTHRLEGILQPVLLEQLEEARDVHVQRATVLAGRERQVLAHAGAAAVARGCGPRTRGGSAASWSAPDWAPSGPRPHSDMSRIMRPSSSSVVEIRLGRRPAREAVEESQRLVQADAAGDALAAGFRMGELDEVARHVHHAVVFVHHHHAAGAHDGAQLRQRLVVDRRVEHLLRDAAAGRPAGLHGFDGASARRASPMS